MCKTRQEIATEIRNFLKKSDEYAYIEMPLPPYEPPCFLVLKRKQVTFTIMNDKSLFQPYEKTITKEIVVAFVLLCDAELPESFEEYVNLGCPVRIVTKETEIARICSEI